MQTHNERLTLAYAKMALREGFIAATMTKVGRIIDNDKCSTAATDGKNVYFNTEFMDEQTDEQLFGLALHEALHVILMHPWQREGRDPELWNYANDAIINLYIKNRGYSLPDGGVHISWVTEEMTSQYVYDKLNEQQQQDKQNSNSSDDSDSDKQAGGFDGKGDLLDAPEDTNAADMEATVAASAKMAKECGESSSVIDKILDNLGKTNLDWRSELRAMMTSSSRNDYSYRRPSRRFIGSGVYLPSLYDEGLGGLLIAIDISGSMSDDELNQINTEVNIIAGDLSPEFIEVVYCNTDIRSSQRFERGEDIELSCNWGGGTRFKPVFDNIDTMQTQPVGMIYFTDMCGDLAECVEPAFPVIWADTSTMGYSAPFGTKVNVEILR